MPPSAEEGPRGPRETRRRRRPATHTGADAGEAAGDQRGGRPGRGRPCGEAASPGPASCRGRSPFQKEPAGGGRTGPRVREAGPRILPGRLSGGLAAVLWNQWESGRNSALDQPQGTRRGEDLVRASLRAGNLTWYLKVAFGIGLGASGLLSQHLFYSDHDHSEDCVFSWEPSHAVSKECWPRKQRM
ncbi:uncharacterized protein LOC102510336 isoform X2 [Camelus ferus]|uniref:Uncharacterized protein LOC102510336 isoform X2 n=1 Tax=Camelus ferus TaxID=419612 RepID=A0A8B8UE72_CAMFR|nr:uncharacterized protein LOC102510336 isoform X2 [Camelus ferus]